MAKEDKAARDARLAAALRANLRRRKTQGDGGGPGETRLPDETGLPGEAPDALRRPAV